MTIDDKIAGIIDELEKDIAALQATKTKLLQSISDANAAIIEIDSEIAKATAAVDLLKG